MKFTLALIAALTATSSMATGVLDYTDQQRGDVAAFTGDRGFRVVVETDHNVILKNVNTNTVITVDFASGETNTYADGGATHVDTGNYSTLVEDATNHYGH